MAQGASHDLIPGSGLGRAEVTAAIEILAGEVARLARNLNCAVDSANWRGNSPDVFAEVSEALPYKTEAKNIALSPDQDAETKESIAGKLAKESPADFTTSQPEPTHVCGLEDNAIAARVADLYERLGGFITPSPSKEPDHNT